MLKRLIITLFMHLRIAGVLLVAILVSSYSSIGCAGGGTGSASGGCVGMTRF